MFKRLVKNHSPGDNVVVKFKLTLNRNYFNISYFVYCFNLVMYYVFTMYFTYVDIYRQETKCCIQACAVSMVLGVDNNFKPFYIIKCELFAQGAFYMGLF